MVFLKRYFILFNCLILCLIFAKSSHAQDNNVRSFNQAQLISLLEDSVILNKKLENLEKTISQLNRTQLELEYIIDRLQKEKDFLSRVLKEKDESKGQIYGLVEKIVALEKENVILEIMFKTQAKGLRCPELVKPKEENLDKVIHLNLGFAYGMKGKLKEAIQEYQRALKYDPQGEDIHYNLGCLFSKVHRYKEAIEEYKMSLKGLPEDREVYYNLAIIYLTRLKDLASGQEYYQKFLELSSSDTGLSAQQIEELLPSN